MTKKADNKKDKEKIDDEGMKNLIGFFSLLIKIDQRIRKKEEQSHGDKQDTYPTL